MNGRPSPTVMECITLPCLKILQGLIKPSMKDKKEKSTSADATLPTRSAATVDVYKWIDGYEDHSFAAWDKRHGVGTSAPPTPALEVGKASKAEVRAFFLMEKYFGRWRQNVKGKSKKSTVGVDSLPSIPIANSTWLKNVLFNPSSRMARQVACTMVETFCAGSFERKKEVVDLLTTFLDELKCEASSEFIALFHRLIATDHWKYYLSVKGVLTKIASLISREIDILNRLERVTLNSDLAQVRPK